MVLLAFALASQGGSKSSSADASGGATAAVVVTVPPPSPAVVEPCAQLQSALPIQLDGLDPRLVHQTPVSASVVAWGDPAVVLACGVSRPNQLVPDSSALITEVNGVDWLPVSNKDSTVFTAIDRAVYVQLTVPLAQTGKAISTVSSAITKTLPAVCHTPDAVGAEPTTTTPIGPLCTRRP